MTADPIRKGAFEARVRAQVGSAGWATFTGADQLAHLWERAASGWPVRVVRVQSLFNPILEGQAS